MISSTRAPPRSLRACGVVRSGRSKRSSRILFARTWSGAPWNRSLVLGADQGRSVDELREEFRNSVDDFLEFCADRGEDPEKPCSGKLLLRIDPELHRAAPVAAGKRGMSLNAWISGAIEEAVPSANNRQERISGVG